MQNPRPDKKGGEKEVSELKDEKPLAFKTQGR